MENKRNLPIIKDKKGSLTASPIAFTRLWRNDNYIIFGKNGQHNFSIWKLTPPKDYVALGYYFKFNKPAIEPTA